MAPSDPDASYTRIPFTTRDEASILALAKWMRIAAVIGIATAAGRVVAAFTPRHDGGQLVGAVISLLLGVWTYQAASAFAAVATTDTADQRFLMRGFSLLRRVFLLQAILVFITLGLLIAVLMGAAVFMMWRH